MNATIEVKAVHTPNSCFQEISYNDYNFSILIRRLEEEDAEMIHSAVLLSRENLKSFMDWSHRETSIEQQKERIRASMESFSKGISYDFVVVDIETKEFLMSASLHASRVPNKKSLGIGYWTSSLHCNKGLATLVTKILVVTAFEKLGCDRVEIGCNKANQKSIRVIEKSGFKFECEARNYFSEPSYDIIKNGYNEERAGLLYTLVKTDVKDLKWYDSIVRALTFK